MTINPLSMNSVKTIIFPVLFSVILFSCINEKKKKKADTHISEKAIQNEKQQSTETLILLRTDSLILTKIQELDSEYPAIPFYINLDQDTLYITSTRKYDYGEENFNGKVKYGIVNQNSEVLLDLVFDKVYNPNLTLLYCLEFKKGTKVGLVNYKTLEVLQPEFDYILPASNLASEKAYGYKDNSWFEITNSSINKYEKTEFDPSAVLNNLVFDAMKLGNNLMFHSYSEHYEGDPFEGNGVLITPSYIEHLNLLNEHYPDIIASTSEELHFGTQEAKVKTDSMESISEKIKAFLVSIYEIGIDGRGYQKEASSLIIQNKEHNSLNNIKIHESYVLNSICPRISGFQFITDSIIEIKSLIENYDNNRTLYNFETSYRYYQIEANGSISELTTNRYFTFTKFAYITQDHFKGCYAKYKEIKEDDENNIWLYDHLTIEDLDIMRNEIFAEYGYKFKSEKWQQYFGKKKWYKPQYENVDNQLTDIDKENIKTILKVKALLQKDEQKYINKRPDSYYAAG